MTIRDVVARFIVETTNAPLAEVRATLAECMPPPDVVPDPDRELTATEARLLMADLRQVGGNRLLADQLTNFN